MLIDTLQRGTSIDGQATAASKTLRSASADLRIPIFVHSLFRSGSTYVFNAFRRARDGDGPLYAAFQESIHEFVSAAAKHPELLLRIAGRGHEQHLLRHPELDAPYWKEVYEVHDAWRDVIGEEIVYADYFGGYAPEKTAAYLAAIIASAPRRPVIQECRTSLRLERLKSSLGGVHIHLWRNPWDQWWSFKSDGYFDTALQLILNAPLCPPGIAMLKRAIDFPAMAGATLREQLDFYARRRPTAEASYLTFFMLWMMALEHGRRAADVDINIDLLSTSAEYRRSAAEKLTRAGIEGLDFSDARSPQAFYGEADSAFFGPLEKQARDMLTQSGYPAASLDALDEVRAEAAPQARRDGLERELIRLRDVLRRVENREAYLLAGYASELDAARQQAAEAARQHHQAIAALHASTSWRVTAPLRFLTRGKLASGKYHDLIRRARSKRGEVARSSRSS